MIWYTYARTIGSIVRRCFLKAQPFTGRIEDRALGALISIILEIAIHIMAERLSVI